MLAGRKSGGAHQCAAAQTRLRGSRFKDERVRVGTLGVASAFLMGMVVENVFLHCHTGGGT